MSETCANCGGPKSVRNPTGACDHLYWPDMLTPEAKAKIGLPELSRIQGKCITEMGRLMAIGPDGELCVKW